MLRSPNGLRDSCRGPRSSRRLQGRPVARRNPSQLRPAQPTASCSMGPPIRGSRTPTPPHQHPQSRSRATQDPGRSPWRPVSTRGDDRRRAVAGEWVYGRPCGRAYPGHTVDVPPRPCLHRRRSTRHSTAYCFGPSGSARPCSQSPGGGNSPPPSMASCTTWAAPWAWASTSSRDCWF